MQSHKALYRRKARAKRRERSWQSVIDRCYEERDTNPIAAKFVLAFAKAKS